MKYFTTISLITTLILTSTSIQSISAQTLTVGQVHNYKVGDIICTKIDNGEIFPDYSIDTFISRVDGNNQSTFVRNRTVFSYQGNKGKWIGTHYRDTFDIVGLSSPYFLRFLSKDSSVRDKDTGNNVVWIYEVKDSVFRDPCNKVANYSRQKTWKPSTGLILQTITVYEALGVYMHFEQSKNNVSLIDESIQYYISNGNFCGDSSVMKAFRNLSITSAHTKLIKIFPNPFQSTITLTGAQEGRYIIRNMLGLPVAMGEIINGELDLNDLNQGNYLLTIITENSVSTEIIIKE